MQVEELQSILKPIKEAVKYLEMKNVMIIIINQEKSASCYTTWYPRLWYLSQILPTILTMRWILFLQPSALYRPTVLYNSKKFSIINN